MFNPDVERELAREHIEELYKDALDPEKVLETPSDEEKVEEARERALDAGDLPGEIAKEDQAG